MRNDRLMNIASELCLAGTICVGSMDSSLACTPVPGSLQSQQPEDISERSIVRELEAISDALDKGLSQWMERVTALAPQATIDAFIRHQELRLFDSPSPYVESSDYPLRKLLFIYSPEEKTFPNLKK
jgi:hypothetical protein